MTGKRDLVFLVDLKESSKIIFENPYYILIKELLGKYGDKATPEDYGNGITNKPLHFLGDERKFMNYVNYGTCGLTVHNQSYIEGSSAKLYLRVHYYNSGREKDTFLNEVQADFKRKFGIESINKIKEK